jgi:hypothetical protein
MLFERLALSRDKEGLLELATGCQNWLLFGYCLC